MRLHSDGNSQILRKDDRQITINVSGRRFSTWESTLKRHPNTLLGSEAFKQFLDKEKMEYFLDRDPHMFRYILNFYRVGKLHFSMDDCIDSFQDELTFYGIRINSVSDCCSDNCAPVNNKSNHKAKNGKSNFEKHTRHSYCFKQGQHGTTSKLKKQIWNLLESTETSKTGRVIQSFFGLLIYVSVLSIIVETIKCKSGRTCEQEYPKIFFGIDAFCMGFFTLEYLLRFYAANNKLSFIINRYNVIDLLTICPFYIHLALKFLWSVSERSTDDVNALDILRILRVFRIFKLSKHSKHMRKMVSRLTKAFTDLGFLFFAFILANVLFASVLYFLERNTAGTKFRSIPDAMWYCIITMMTVGYGDMVPLTVVGKLVGFICCLGGIIMLTLPIPILQESETK